MKLIRTLLLLSVASFAGYAVSSCAAQTEEIVLCDDCGVEKGAEGCCDESKARCDDCGKIKDSAGCCK